MVTLVSRVSSGEVSWCAQPSDDPELRDIAPQQDETRAYGVCSDPTTVIGAILCDNKTAVSNACRRAGPGTVDSWICDDRNLEKVQDGLFEVAKKAAIKAVELLFGAKVSR